MRKDIDFTVSPADRHRLRAIVSDPKLPPERVARIIRLTQEPPPHEATH